jgi:hypothetical protein
MASKAKKTAQRNVATAKPTENAGLSVVVARDTRVRNDQYTLKHEIHFVADDIWVHAPVYQVVTIYREASVDVATGNVVMANYRAEGDGTIDKRGKVIFDEVKVPAVAGYSGERPTVAFEASVQKNAAFTSTIRFIPNMQSIRVEVHDGSSDRLLDSLVLQGYTDDLIDWAPVDELLDFYRNRGYEIPVQPYEEIDLFSSEEPETISINLQHGIKTVQESKTLSIVVLYQGAGAATPKPIRQQAQVMRQYTIDKVSNKRTGITYQAGDAVNVDEAGTMTYEIPTPEVLGYVADVSVVAGHLSYDAEYATKTVSYHPVKQQAIARIVDETAGEVLADIVVEGLTGEEVDWSETKPTMDDFWAAGYNFTSDERILIKTFGADPEQPLVAVVKMTHRLTERTDAVTLTNRVRYEGDASPLPASVSMQVKVDKTIYHDEVTHQIATTDYEFVGDAEVDKNGLATFKTIVSPELAGYKAEPVSVTGAMAVDGPTTNELVVTYVAEMQEVSVKIIDQEAQEVLQVVTESGLTATAVDWSVAQTDVQRYLSDGYELVSDGTSDVTTFMPGSQEAVVYLGHQVKTVESRQTLTNTVHYFGGDDEILPAATQQATVTQIATVDVVTNETKTTRYVAFGDAIVNEQGRVTFLEPEVPLVAGFELPSAEVHAVTNFNDPENLETEIVYHGQPAVAHVEFINEADGELLRDVTLHGFYMGSVDSTDAVDALIDFVSDGYELISDELGTLERFNKDDHQVAKVVLRRHD